MGAGGEGLGETAKGPERAVEVPVSDAEQERAGLSVRVIGQWRRSSPEQRARDAADRAYEWPTEESR